MALALKAMACSDFKFHVKMFLTLLLLDTTCSVLANSVAPDLKKPTDLDLHCFSLNIWISIKNQDQVIWLADK